MAILRKNNKQRYTTILHDITTDENLSLKDLGLLVKLLSLPDDWDFSEKGLEKILKNDGQTSLRTALKNLEKYGYLKRIRTRDELGRVTKIEWYVYENPHFENHSLDTHSFENDIQYNIKESNIKESNIKYNNGKCKNSEWEHEQVKEKLKAIDNMDVKTRLVSLMKYRLAKNKPVTIEVLKLILDKLERYSDGDDKKKIAILERSIEKGYDTVYELVQKENIKANKWGIYEDEHEASYNIEDEENYCLSNEYDDDLAYWTEQLGE